MAIKFKTVISAIKDVPSPSETSKTEAPHGGWLAHKPSLGVVNSYSGNAEGPDKPLSCAEHVLNPVTKTCVCCLEPMADHELASVPTPMPALSRFKIKIAEGAPDGKPLVAPEPAVKPTGIMAALTGQSQQGAPPWEAPDGYTILDALNEHWARSQKGEVLQLIAVKNAATSWTVKSYSPETGRAVLEGMDKLTIRPVLGVREVPLYSPFWRGK